MSSQGDVLFLKVRCAACNGLFGDAKGYSAGS